MKQLGNGRVVVGVGVIDVSAADRVKLMARLHYIRAQYVLYQVSYSQHFLRINKTL